MNIINFEIESAEVLEENNPDSRFMTAKIRAFCSDKNRNKFYCSEETLERTASTIYGCPIVYNITGWGTFGTHADPEDSLIAGYVLPDSSTFERLPDGRLGLNVLAKIFKIYAPKVVSILKKEQGKTAVSVEMNLLDYEKMNDGFTDMKDFMYHAVALLGNFVRPGIESAELEVLSFAEQNKQVKEAYNEEFGAYDEIDFSIPESVKKNAKKGLELKQKYNLSPTSVSMAIGRHLSNAEKSNPEKVRHIGKAFSGSKFSKVNKEESDVNYVTYMLHGGKPASMWAVELTKKLEEKDKTRMSFFDGEVVTFPYKSLKDANPAIRGINPPVSLEQANQIAKQADAVGTDDKVNGWAVAISSFKKTHKVEDDKWVKKEFSEKEVENMEEKKVEEENMAEESQEEKKEEQESPSESEKFESETEKKDEEKEEAEEEKEEQEEESEEEDEEEEFSLEAYLDAPAMLAMLESETEDYAKVKAEMDMGKDMNLGLVMGAMYAKMCKMAEEAKDLKKFKEDVEKQQFDFEVGKTMKEIEAAADMPKAEFEAIREQAKEFSLATVDAWKNYAKAKALDFAVKGKTVDTVVKYGLLNQETSKKSAPSLWDRKQLAGK
jgi:hypothetical protein